uniref:BZIP domain-containing protein n=1 Tax=Denticeps clupeoides TaxID=299321 RepID=A0AAY4CX49_9TELE
MLNAWIFVLTLIGIYIFLISTVGDGFSDWMTEKSSVCLYVPLTESSPSSSLQASSQENDVQVPSDLEIMTSILQEEFAQLEDYFLTDSTPSKVEKLQKCHKGPQGMGPPSCYQLPYASYSPSQSETNPLLVTLATGELDQVSFCGGPMGRPKMLRPAPYGYVSSHYNNRRTAPNAFRDGVDSDKQTWSSKDSYSGCEGLVVDHSPLDRTFGRSPGGVKKVRECAVLLKQEESGHFRDDVFCSVEMSQGYCMSGPLSTLTKKEGHPVHGMKSMSCHEGMEQLLQCSTDARGLEFKECQSSEEYLYHHHSVNTEPYPRFMDAGVLEFQRSHNPYHECLGESYECVSGGESVGSSVDSTAHRTVQRPKGNTCAMKPDLRPDSVEGHHGERKQKKRDQNKTAAYRYRQRKRAELDSLEEELHGLEGLNRELRDKAESVEREIQYVKDLLIEVYKARSQRLKEDSSA